jgi:hypothetical protein
MTEPTLRVHRGAPDDLELAALVTALTLVAAGAAAPPAAIPAQAGWRERARDPGRAPLRRPGGWRVSALPH